MDSTVSHFASLLVGCRRPHEFVFRRPGREASQSYIPLFVKSSDPLSATKAADKSPAWKQALLARGRAEWMIISLIILSVLFVRFHLLGVPLERDEGEYAYMGQLLLKGIPPYLAAYNMKFPGTYLMYAAIMSVFGQSTEGIHLGLTLINCCTIILIYLLGKRLSGGFVGIIAAAAYSVLSLSPSVEGQAAHATHFVVLAAVGGMLLLLAALERQGPNYLFFWSGLVTGLAFIMKQPGFFFVLCSASLVIRFHFSGVRGPSSKLLSSRIALLTLGALVPLVATLAWLEYAGVFSRFWFWSIQYASEYVTQIPLSHALDIFVSQVRRVVDGFYAVWVLAISGLLIAFSPYGPKSPSRFVALFTFFSFLTICPGYYFREHYFVTLLPSVAILVGISAQFLQTKLGRFLRPPFPTAIGAGVVMAGIVMGVAASKDFFLGGEPSKISREISGLNPFPEAVKVAQFIASRSDPTDKVAVLGSEPEIYFYAGRMSATGYIYTYSLMEDQTHALAMQKEMIAEIESAKPRFIVVVSTPASWAQRPGSEEYIFRWMGSYIPANYTSVGVADVISRQVTNYVWDEDARWYEIKGNSALRVFSRKP